MQSGRGGIEAGHDDERHLPSGIKISCAKNISAAARYNTKRGIANLGPAGFVFEQFVEIVLHELGYKTARNKFVKGMCVSHEVDVLAWKGGEHVIVEAKYHNQPNTKTHIDQVMYADARLMDIERAHEKNGERGVRHTIWVFTNTKFTEKAIRYAKCRNMRLTGWGYPAKENLEILVDRFLLHPVTVLPSVDRFSLERLSQAGVMLARDIAPYTPEKFARAVNIDLPRAQKSSEKRTRSCTENKRDGTKSQFSVWRVLDVGRPKLF